MDVDLVTYKIELLARLAPEELVLIDPDSGSIEWSVLRLPLRIDRRADGIWTACMSSSNHVMGVTHRRDGEWSRALRWIGWFPTWDEIPDDVRAGLKNAYRDLERPVDLPPVRQY